MKAIMIMEIVAAYSVIVIVPPALPKKPVAKGWKERSKELRGCQWAPHNNCVFSSKLALLATRET